MVEFVVTILKRMILPLFSIKDGLPDDVAYKILEDEQSNLWFGTNRGLVRFNPESKDVRVYTTKDGLLGNQFNYKSALKGGGW